MGGSRIHRSFEQPRLLPAHWSLLGRGSKGELLLPEEETEEQGQTSRGITDDGNYSRPTGTSVGSVFITRYLYIMILTVLHLQSVYSFLKILLLKVA